MATAALYKPDTNSGQSGPLTDVKQFVAADFASDVDLTALTGYRAQPARCIRIDAVTVGSEDTLVIDTLDSATLGTPASRTLTVKTGDSFDLQVVRIKSTTTVTRLTVGW
jgi:hypothetical protein